MKIQDMPSGERPRERMMEAGERSLSNSELLAVIIGSGTRQMNAVEVAGRLICAVGGQLGELCQLGASGMQKIPGIGKGKSLQLCACLELGRRIALEQARSEYGVIEGPEDAINNLIPLYNTDRHEECWCLFLKSNRRILSSMMVSSGGESMTGINCKAIIRKALDLGAKAVIISHNHPSGDSQPSNADIKATEDLISALKSFEITLMDHIILGDKSCFSFSLNRKLSKSGKKCKKM